MSNYYMIAEMLPVADVEEEPGDEFAPGSGFESSICDFWVYGPASCWQDFDTDHERLVDEGYECYFEATVSPIM
jgi:hypothetical protein